MSAPTVVFLGPPGVGKGTQGALLAEARGWSRLVTGDLLREARNAGTEVGNLARSYMDAGELVPDEVVLELVREKLGELGSGTGVLFDGFPRTRAQAEGLAGILSEQGRGVDAVVLLEAPDEELVRRLSGRRTCSECGAIHNLHLDPPEREDACDQCGGELVQRSDDRPETVRNRLDVYRRETEPLISYYEEGDPMLLRVPGTGSVEEVRAELARQVESAVAP